jgi:hypothetical protein
MGRGDAITAVSWKPRELVSEQTAYETSHTSTRRGGMCQVGASRKFVSEEAVAILRHRVFAKHVLLATFRHRAENWGVSRCPIGHESENSSCSA